jgi:hypothetical protein
MKKMIIVTLSLALLFIAPWVWAGMGGGMGGGYGGGHMGGGMMGSGNQQGDRSYWNTDRYEREDRARRQYEEDTRGLRRDIDAKRDALDRELNRSDPDLSEVRRLHRDLNQLQDELNLEQRRYDQFRQEEAGRYDDGRYPRRW